MKEKKKAYSLRKRFNRGGMIFIVVLWALVILSLLAVGLGRRTSIDLNMTKYALGKLRAKYIARAGLVYAFEQIQKDTQDKEGSRFDNVRLCGLILEEGESRESLFESIKVGEGFFSIYVEGVGSEEVERKQYGFTDEERKININALDKNNYTILQYLIMEMGYDEDLSRGIAASVLDWIDGDDEVFGGQGAESDHYRSLAPPFSCKNAPLDSLTELLSVKHMTPYIFHDIEKYLTIFPKKGKFLVNLDTAPEKVLLALAKRYAGNETKTDIYDAESLAGKMVAYRKGPDDEAGTHDDRLLEINEMALNAKEKVIFLMMMNDRTKISQYIRAVITGVDEKTSISYKIDTIINRDDLTVVYWNRGW